MDDTSDIEYKKNQLLNTQSCVSLVKHDHWNSDNNQDVHV